MYCVNYIRDAASSASLLSTGCWCDIEQLLKIDKSEDTNSPGKLSSYTALVMACMNVNVLWGHRISTSKTEVEFIQVNSYMEWGYNQH